MNLRYRIDKGQWYLSLFDLSFCNEVKMLSYDSVKSEDYINQNAHKIFIFSAKQMQKSNS